MRFSLDLPFAQVVFTGAKKKHRKFFDDWFFSLKNATKVVKYRINVIFETILLPAQNQLYLEENAIFSDSFYYILDTKGNATKLNLASFNKDIINIYVEENFDLYYLYNYIVEPLIIIWGASHGLLYLHSSVLAKNNNAYILAAWRHTGKTSTIFNLVGKDIKFMGDDFSVVYDSKVYLYQKSLNIFSYNFETYPWLYGRLSKSLSLRIRLSVYMKKFLYYLSQKFSGPFSKVFFRLSELAEISTNTKITPARLGYDVEYEANMEKLVFLTKSGKAEVFIKNMSQRQIQEKLLSIVVYEINDFLCLYRKYRYIYPDKGVENIDKFELNYKDAVKQNIKFAEDVGIESFKGQDTYLAKSFLKLGK